MRTTEERRGRRRIDGAAVHTNAKNSGNRGSQTLAVPEGWKEWRPEKEEEFELRVLPYVVSLGGHPDDREIGSAWYRRPYRVHFSVGGTDKAVVCPKSFGKPCPICQELDLLYKDGYEKNKKVIDSIKATRFVLFAAYVNGDKENPVVFAWNESKFAALLEKELKKGKPENFVFSDSDEGRLLIVRTTMEEPGSKEFKAYLTADRIDFTDAGDLKYLTDDQLDAVPKLDECLKQMSYEKISKLFHGIEDEAEEEQEEPPKQEKPKREVQEKPDHARRKEQEEPPKQEKPKREEPDRNPPKGDVCVACNGVGRNSRGRLCASCGGTGTTPATFDDPKREEKVRRSEPEKPTPPKQEESQPDASDEEW